MRADVDVDLAQRAVAGVDEPVRRVGRDDGDLARDELDLLVADRERPPPFLHDEDLLVGVLVEPWPLARRGIDEQETYAHAAVVVAHELARDDAERELVLAQDGHARASFRRRTLGVGPMPGRSPGDGSGSPNAVTMGTTPAQVSSCASGVSSSSGGPDLVFTDASSMLIVRIVVALSSLRLGWRTSSQRPGRSLLVKAANAASRALSSSTWRKPPTSITAS